jgi:coenzyme PQQ precursor peptide PqqA
MGPSPPPRSYLRWKSLQNASCRKVAFRIIFNCTEAVRALSDAPSDHVNKQPNNGQRKTIMAWTTPTLLEICIGLEINGYLPAEF